MNGAVAKKTQETLGKVIKKPPLTEKLLNKPPFRFLHDIFTEVIRATGFMKGLFSETEMKSENVKEKEAKMLFLQKAIDVVTMVSGEPLSVKPARIVAGHEPEKTNELLQALARCCLNKMSSEDAVKKVLSGEKPELKSKASTSKSQNKENREEPEPPEREEKVKRQKADESKERQRNRETEQRHEKHQRDKSKDKGRPSEKDQDQTRDRDRDRNRERDKDRAREKEKDRRRREKDPERSRTKSRDEDSKAQLKTEEPPQNPSPEEPPKPVAESSARIPRPSSAKGQRRRAKVGSQDESDSEGDGEVKPVPPENPPDSASALDPVSSSNRRTVRPSSARPAPPRVRRTESHAESPSERLSSAKPTAVIIDGKKTEEEENEDEQFLVQEAVSAETETHHTDSLTQEAEADDKHGGLVKKILETKKYYEVSPSSPKDKSAVSGEAQRKERDLVHREIERLRSSIQTVCRSALPLGKIMDYIQEDMDAMKNELQLWRTENREHALALTLEQSATEQAMKPLKSELEELEQLIRDQQARICVIRSTVLKNEEKIQKMVTGINFSNKT